jgi:nucleoside-diphosphate-sugar epimerase
VSLYPERYLARASDFLKSKEIDFTGQKILITGGSGFVGSWVVDLLKYYTDKNFQDVEILGLTRNLTLTRQKLGNENFEFIQWVEGGVERIADLKFQFTHALHAATPATKESGFDDTSNMKFASEEGMNLLLERAQINGNQPRVLHTSSGAVYGNREIELDYFPLMQDITQIRLDKDLKYFEYALTKRKAESMLNSATLQGFVSGLNARLFAFYGPGLPTTSHYAIGNLVEQGLNAKKLQLNGNGEAIRSYLPVNIMGATILCAMESDIEGATHIGSDEGHTLKYWAELVADIVGKEIEFLGKFDDSDDKYVAEIDERISGLHMAHSPHEILTTWIEYVKKT